MNSYTFFNKHPKGEVFTYEAVSAFVGQTVPIRIAGVLKGYGKITEAKVDKYGIYITYQTDADIGITIELEF